MGNLAGAGLGMTIGIIGGPFTIGLGAIFEKPAKIAVKTKNNKNF